MTLSRRRAMALLAGGVAGLGLPGWARAIGPGSRLVVPLLEYSGGLWNPRPNGLRKMLQEVEKRTSITTDPRAASVRASDKAGLLANPLLVWSGEGDFSPLSPAEIEHLGLFLRAGGTILVDSADAARGGPFVRAARREIARILPGRPFVDIPRSHVLFKSFYLIPEPLGRVAVAQTMQAIFGEDRAMVLLNQNDLQGAWSRDNLGNYDFDVFPGGERQREMAYRLGINVVMYSMCLNYKEDQVHVPFILKRRKWKID